MVLCANTSRGLCAIFECIHCIKNLYFLREDSLYVVIFYSGISFLPDINYLELISNPFSKSDENTCFVPFTDFINIIVQCIFRIWNNELTVENHFLISMIIRIWLQICDFNKEILNHNSYDQITARGHRGSWLIQKSWFHYKMFLLLMVKWYWYSQIICCFILSSLSQMHNSTKI